MSEKEVEENDEQVQDFAEDEPAEIYVVPGWWGTVYKCYVGDRRITEEHLKKTYLLVIFFRKNATSLSFFSSWSSINLRRRLIYRIRFFFLVILMYVHLVVVPLPKNFMSPPSMLSQQRRGQ